MKSALKAALISALVFPGCGHFYLRKTIPGILLCATALIGLYFLFAAIMEVAMQISSKIQSGEIPFDFYQIHGMVNQQITMSESQKFNLPLLILLTSWVVGIVDSARLGRLSDKNNSESKQKSATGPSDG